MLLFLTASHYFPALHATCYLQRVRRRKIAKKWRGKSKTQIPGGQFVEVKKKCKTFPYCNQGNTGAVSYTKTAPKPKLTKRTKLAEAIYNVSQKTGLSEEEIKNIIIKDIDDKLN